MLTNVANVSYDQAFYKCIFKNFYEITHHFDPPYIIWSDFPMDFGSYEVLFERISTT